MGRRVRECKGKIAYPSRENALRAVYAARGVRGLDLGKPYDCFFCPYWHNGHAHPLKRYEPPKTYPPPRRADGGSSAVAPPDPYNQSCYACTPAYRCQECRNLPTA